MNCLYEPMQNELARVLLITFDEQTGVGIGLFNVRGGKYVAYKK